MMGASEDRWNRALEDADPGEAAGQRIEQEIEDAMAELDEKCEQMSQLREQLDGLTKRVRELEGRLSSLKQARRAHG